ncbi:hypothetical protein D3C72_1269810 [compost metagenome]
MQSHNVVLTGLLAEIVEDKFRHPTQRVSQLEQACAGFHHLRRQFAHFKPVFGNHGVGRQIGADLMLKNLDQLTHLFAVIFQTFVVGQPRWAFRAILRHALFNLTHDHVQLQIGRQRGDFAVNL